MESLGTTAPDTDPAIQRLLTESREQLAESISRREELVESVAAVLFLAVAIPLAVFAESPRALDIPVAAGLIALYVIACRVEFRMGSGWTDPSQLVFVPMLFLLPLPAVPLIVASALLISRLPEYVSRTVHSDRVVLRIADAWYSIWPTAVLLAFGATTFEWGDWPVYALAVAAQFGIDSLTTATRVRIGLGVPPRMIFSELRAIYLVDALLTPIGLLAASAATEEPWALVALAPLIALITIFAREREARIENALALSGAYRGTAHLLGELLTSSHEYTGEHSRSVVVLAHRVGDVLGLDEATMRDLEFGALLHDVGKMAVPNELLNKPDRLTDEETAVMRQHTAAGAEMLQRIGGVLGEVGIVVRSHHERYDGTGYPDGLRGEEIPIAARVISACDAFSAMTDARPYRSAMSAETAVEELRREAGRQFDPAVVAALVEVLTGRGPADQPDIAPVSWSA